MNEKPIFVLGAHKSGTSLLRSVLDGHPNLFVIPFETHFFQNLNYWVDYNYRMERPKDLSREQIIKRFRSRLETTFNSKDPIGDVPLQLNIDLKAFEQSFNSISVDMTNKELFEHYVQSLYNGLFKKSLPDFLRVVEKSVEHAEFAKHLEKMFPEAQFVHIIRNPYANSVALRNYKSTRSKFPLIFRLLNTLYNNYYYLYQNQHLIKYYHVVRYEDLITNTKHEIAKLTEFLDLPYNKIMMSPTKLGRIWQGNSSSRKKIIGFDKSRIDSWKSSVSAMEITYINKLFSFIFDDFGYEKHPTPSFIKFLKPLPTEGPLRYIVNRGYLAYLSYNRGSEIQNS